MDIENDRKINPDALDVEWLEYSNAFYEYSENLDNKTKDRNELKLDVERQEEEVKRIKADLDFRIRKNPEEFELGKVTENSIASTILTSPEYQEAQDNLFTLKMDLNTIQDEVNRAYTEVNTMLSKKTALQELDGLLRMQYFSTPSEARDLSQEYRERQEYSRKAQITKAKVKGKIRGRRKT